MPFQNIHVAVYIDFICGIYVIICGIYVILILEVVGRPGALAGVSDRNRNQNHPEIVYSVLVHLPWSHRKTVAGD